MGRGRVRCLKHEGEPPRFVRNAPANGTTTNGKVAAKPKTGKKTTTGSTNGVVKKSAPKKRAAAKRP
jgi:hypothetical protein